jgi:hypothetical protein
MGILGLGWFLLRQLSVGFLGARFWLAIGGAWFVVFTYFVIRYFVIFYRLEILYYKQNFAPKKVEKAKISQESKEEIKEEAKA